MHSCCGSVACQVARLALSLLVGVAPAIADGEYLIEDIGQIRTYTLAEGATLPARAVVDEVAYFFQDDGRHGYELWRTDGTSVGTYMVRDVCPGRCGAEQLYSFGLAAVGSQVFFAADDGIHGVELWVTDGTHDGTHLVADLEPGPRSSRPAGMIEASERLWFLAGTTAAGQRRDIWTSDGTAEGTQRLLPAGKDPMGGRVMSLLAGQNLVFAIVAGEDDYELWRSDATVSGTYVVHPGFSSPTLFEGSGAAVLLANGVLVFGGCALPGSPSDCEPWRSDGTVAGTFRLADLRPGEQSSYPIGFQRVGDEVWFEADPSAGSGLYRTDGTAAGTLPVSLPGDVQINLRWGAAASLGTGLVFVGCDPGTGCEPWFSDGVTTNRIADLVPGSGSSVGSAATMDRPRMTSLGARVAFLADDGSGQLALWSTDGSAPGTSLASDLDDYPPGSQFGYFPAIARSIVVQGRWLLPLFRPDRGRELWQTDGTATGTSRLVTIATEASAFLPTVESVSAMVRRRCMVPLAGGALFKAANRTVPRQHELMFANGVPASVESLLVIEESDESMSAECAAGADGALVLRSANQEGELWRTDGTGDNTELLLSQFSASSVRVFERHGSRLAFIGSDAETFGQPTLYLVSAPDEDEPVSRLATAMSWGETASTGELLFVAGHDGGLEVTDGSEAPTTLLEAPADPEVHHELFDAVAVEQGLFFVLDTPQEGAELWRSDGSVAGTAVVRNLIPGQVGGMAEWSQLDRVWGRLPGGNIAALDAARVVFQASDGVSGFELWTSDGTEAGTVLVADLVPGPGGSWPRHLTSLGDGTVLFAAEHPVYGYELFRTDGTAAGTALVADLVPGIDSSVPDELTVVDGIVYFSAWTSEHGREAWRTDGTAVGTWRLTDVAPGPLSSSPANFVRSGGRLFFSASDHVHGFELWAMPEDGSGSLFLDGFESGDTSRWSAELP